MGLPRAAKRISSLRIPDINAQRNKTKDSYHTILLAISNSREKKPKKIKFLKIPHDSAPVPNFEAACADLFRLIDLEGSPKTRVYYKDKRVAAVASTLLPGFKANEGDPLKSDNLIIGELELVGTHELREALKKLLHTYSDSIEQEKDQSLSARVYSGFANTYNSLLCKYTSVYTKNVVDNFILNKTKFTLGNLVTILQSQLNERIKYIKEEITKTTTPSETKTKYEAERKKIIVLLRDILILSKKQSTVSAKTIERFEELDRLYYGSALDNLSPEDLKLNVEENDTSLCISVKDLRNYRIIKGLGSGLVASYIFKEGDCHNRNLAKNGKRIDFDMAFWDISWNWKEASLIEKARRFPNADTFKITARDIDNFPNIVDANFYYWPTKQTEMAVSLVEVVHKDLNYYISKNFFRTSDNVVFQKLASNPIFIFHKFKNLLKFVLTSTETHRSILNLHMFEEQKLYLMSTLPANLTLRNACVLTPDGFFQFNEEGTKKLILNAHDLSLLPLVGLATHLQDAAKLKEGEKTEFKDKLTIDQFSLLNATARAHGADNLAGTTFIDKGTRPPTEKNLPKVMLDDITLRAEEIKNVLITMPSFQEFMQTYGETAKNLILEEFGEYRTKYASKRQEKVAIFEDVIQSIDLDKMSKAFDDLKNAVLQEPAVQQPVVPSFIPTETTPLLQKSASGVGMKR